MNATRIYTVKGPQGTYLVKATSQAQAIRHVVSPLYTCEPSKQADLVELLSSGVKVVEAHIDPVE